MTSRKKIMTEHDIPGRFKAIMERMQTAIRSLGLSDNVRIDEDKLGRAVYDYFEDIDRLKDFEGIERINVAKIYAYSTFWILRRSPIVVEKPIAGDERLIYINEVVCAAMLIVLMCTEIGKMPDPGDESTKKYYQLLYYNFKYRDYNQRTLELAVESFLFGNSLSSKSKKR